MYTCVGVCRWVCGRLVVSHVVRRTVDDSMYWLQRVMEECVHCMSAAGV